MEHISFQEFETIELISFECWLNSNWICFLFIRINWSTNKFEWHQWQMLFSFFSFSFSFVSWTEIITKLTEAKCHCSESESFWQHFDLLLISAWEKKKTVFFVCVCLSTKKIGWFQTLKTLNQLNYSKQIVVLLLNFRVCPFISVEAVCQGQFNYVPSRERKKTLRCSASIRACDSPTNKMVMHNKRNEVSSTENWSKLCVWAALA